MTSTRDAGGGGSPPQQAFDLSSTFFRLRPDASVEPLAVNETFWARLIAGELGTFRSEYLVSVHAFDTDWSSWERHPNGDEIVCLLEGAVTFVLELAEGTRELDLGAAGACVLVPRGTWHTARTQGPCRMLFITAGEGTEHRDA